MLFGDERATKVVPSFLRKTKVGQMATIPPRDGEEEEDGEESEPGVREEVEEEEGGRGTPPGIDKGGAGGGGRF